MLALPLFASWGPAVHGLLPQLLDDVVTGVVLGVSPLTCHAVAPALRPHPPGVGFERFSVPALLSVPVTLVRGPTAAGCRACRWLRADLTA